MTNLNVLENKISYIKRYLRILENYKKFSKKEIVADFNIRGGLERYLYLAAQATIDLADAYISYKDYRKPTSLRECFDILCEEEIISSDLAEKLGGMVGFRNVIAHDYGRIDYDIVFKILHQGLKDIKEFVKIIEKNF